MFQIPDELEHGSGVTMRREPSYLLLSFRSPLEDESRVTRKGLRPEAPEPEIERILSAVGLRLARSGIPFPGPESFSEGERLQERATTPIEINDTARLRWVFDPGGRLIDEGWIARTMAAFDEGRRPLQWSGPTYRMPGTVGVHGLVCPVPDIVLVKPRPGADQAEFIATMQELGLEEDEERSNLLIDYMYFRLRSLDEVSAYAIRHRLLDVHHSLVEEARLENVPMLRSTLFRPNDTGYDRQWNMERIGAGGHGRTGWDITMGDPGVIVAVVDSGCDLRHPDLVYVGPGISIEDLHSNAHETKNRHGTNAAGIACAVIDNGMGVAGLAGRCRVLPVKAANSDASVAQGITWASRRHARVINLSIGQPDDGGWDFAVIDPAIAGAHRSGCVLCASTGNDNKEKMRYPARHPLVMACGASDRSDGRWVDGSMGSNYGNIVHLGARTGVSVVAPGIGIPTTEHDDGSNGGIGISAMTSAAAPHVSGLAALLISGFGIDNGTVREIIECSADRVGGFAYAVDPDFPHGPRHAEVGYGRINVLRALELARTHLAGRSGANGSEPEPSEDAAS